MKKYYFSYKYILPFITVVQINFIMSVPANAEDDFGRFFTTPVQRQYLDQLKSRGAPIVVDIGEDLSDTDEKKEAGKEANDAITVKGLVYRKGGQSAAWVNNSNTFEGDVASDFVAASENKITPSGVGIKITGNDEDINLKVGQKYEPATRNITDMSNALPRDFSAKPR